MKEEQKKKTRGRPSTFQKNKTISLAMNCYQSAGVNTLSINELCRRINISKPTLYREFGGEDGLMAESLRQYEKEAFAPLLQLQQSSNIRLALDTLIDTITAENQCTPGCLLTNMKLTEEHLGPSTLQIFEQIQKRIQALYRTFAEMAKTQGHLRPDIHTNTAAQYIETQCTSMLTQMSIGVDPNRVRTEGKLAISVLFL